MRFIYIIILLITVSAQAQQTIRGKVVDNQNQPLTDVIVVNELSEQWAITSENGIFEINDIINNNVTLKFTLLGKQEKIIEFSPKQLTQSLNITLEDEVLRLEGLIATAKKGSKYSEIVLVEEAISQTQSFSLSDVLTQIPGQVLTDFNLSEFKTIAFRTATPPYIESDAAFGNKSFGTAVVVDGIPLSNNENMQDYAGNYGSLYGTNNMGFGDSGAFDFNGSFNNPDFGVDLREIPTQNIEKIEVVQGIPSAKYGDLNSGLIKIEQKAGRSPYRLRTSFRDGATEVGISKGYKIGDKLGHINLSFNYLDANKSPRTSFTEYQRYNTQLMWSWANPSKKIKNSLTANYSFNNDDLNYEEEDEDNKRTKNKKKQISISNRFKWNPEKAFFNNMDINFNFTYADQYTYESKLTNAGGSIVGTGIEEGVYEGVYSPVTYNEVKEIEGIPISAFFATELHNTFTSKKWSHHVTYGVSAKMSDNKGRGRLGRPETLENILASDDVGDGGIAFRPYNYGENVHAEYQYSAYIQDQFIRSWENSTLNIEAGFRYDNQNSFSVLSPRLNTYFATKKIKLRGGIGLTSKAPSLNQVYTGPRYFDVVLADYRLPGYYNIGIVQTFIDSEDNTKLKPSKSLRSEIGFDYNLSFVNISVTGYYNHLYDGFTNEHYAIARELANINFIDHGTEKPDWEITGYTPYYYTSNRIVNNFESTDIGIELMMNFHRLPIKNLQLDINGSYVKTKSNTGIDAYRKSTDNSKNEKYGVYAPYNIYSEQIRLGGNLNYHFPKIGLVVTLRSEHFILEDYYAYEADYPYAYIDANLNKIIIPEADRTNSDLYGHITTNGISREKKYNQLDKVYHNFHLRISKDFLNGFKFSFYANNFLDLKQTEYRYVNDADRKMIKPEMVDLSFGATIEYQF